MTMVAAALSLAIYYSVFRINTVVGDLQTVNDELRSIPEGPCAVERVERVMTRHPLVSRSWKLYRPHLVESADGAAFASRPPERYFGMRMVERSGLRLRFFLGLPNDFVGLGLIFTFMGLVAGLYFANRSMMSLDLGAARDALVQLLHAATFKFLTSIIGIGLSLLLSWRQGMLLGRLYSEIDELSMLLEERFPVHAYANEPRAAQVSDPVRDGPRLVAVTTAGA